MAKRLGGGLLGFGVKSAGEFCMSYECAVRRGARERDLLTLTIVPGPSTASTFRCVRPAAKTANCFQNFARSSPHRPQTVKTCLHVEAHFVFYVLADLMNTGRTRKKERYKLGFCLPSKLIDV
jgi:hypothetical protein